MPQFPSALFGFVTMLTALAAILQVVLGIAFLGTPLDALSVRLIGGGLAVGAVLAATVSYVLNPAPVRQLIGELLGRN